MLMFSIRHADDTSILACSGRIRDGEEAGALATLASDLLRRHGQLTVNVAGSQIDAEGMGVLEDLAILALTTGGQLRVDGLSPNDRREECRTETAQQENYKLLYERRP